MKSINWAASMKQTYEFYVVDPFSWTDRAKLTFISSCDIDRDANSTEKGSATFSMDRMIEECYIRVYMVVSQGDVTEKHPLGTYLVQTANTDRYSTRTSFSLDGYTSLHELSEGRPSAGYFVNRKTWDPGLEMYTDTNIVTAAIDILSEHARAPIVRCASDEVLKENFVADGSETWLDFVNSLLAKANLYLDIDELGQIIFVPNSSIESQGIVWEFSDNEYSILDPTVNMSNDIYGIPNVVEVVYSNNGGNMYAVAKNENRGSEMSIPRRGREIVYRETEPDILGIPTQEQLQEYAENLLESLSTAQYTIDYTHGYCPVRVGDCVRINYNANGLTNIKAKIISQSISCTTGCQVAESVVFTEKLWKRG